MNRKGRQGLGIGLQIANIQLQPPEWDKSSLSITAGCDEECDNGDQYDAVD